MVLPFASSMAIRSPALPSEGKLVTLTVFPKAESAGTCEAVQIMRKLSGCKVVACNGPLGLPCVFVSRQPCKLIAADDRL